MPSPWQAIGLCQRVGFLIAGGMCSLVGGVLLRQVGVHLASKVGRDHY